MAEQPSQADPAWDDVYTLVDEAVAELPEDLRIPVVAHYLLGESHADISRATGVPRSTVSRRISRGVESIGESLKKRGVHIASGVLAGLMAANLAEASAVPAPLMAALGRLALAQSANAGGVSATILAPAAKWVGGILVMKKIAVAVIIVAGAVLALWAFRPQDASRNADSSLPAAAGAQDASVSEGTPGASARSSTPSNTSRPAEAPPAPAKSVVPTSEDQSPSIRGQVVDAGTGQAVAGAEVAAVENGSFAHARQTAKAVSDAEGRFEIAGLHAGGYLVMKETGPEDYMVSLPEDMVDVRLRDGEHREGVTLRTRNGGKVWGTVTDSGGSPVAGASVMLESARNESFQGVKAAYSPVRGLANTDASGQFTIHGVKLRKSCALKARADGYTPVLSSEFLLAGSGETKRVDLKLGRGWTISGWVEDRDGNRRPGIEVTIEPEFEGRSTLDVGLLMSYCRSLGTIKTDENGLFRVEGLPVGSYHLFAGGIRRSPYGYLGGGTCVDLDGIHDAEEIVLRANSLKRGDHAIAGRVSNAEGAVVADAQVDVVQTEPPQDCFFLHTDDTGAFQVDGLTSGETVLAVMKAGYAQTILNSVPLDGPDLAITLQRSTVVRGRVLVRDGGQPVAGARVSVAQHDRPARDSTVSAWLFDRFDSIRENMGGRETATTGGDGAFEFAGIEPGHVRLKAERAGYATSTGDEVVVEPGRPLEGVTIYMGRGGTVEGFVRDIGGAPVAGASILTVEYALKGESRRDAELRLLRATNWGEGSENVKALTDAAGHFAVEGLPDGDHWIRALAVGYASSAVAKVSLADGSSQSGIELTLDPGGTVEGYVTLAGVPKPDVIMQGTREGADADAIRVYTNAEGYYIIEHLMPGEHEIRAADIGRPGNAGLQTAQVVVVSGKTIRQDFDYNNHVLKGKVLGLASPAEWQVAVLRIPEGVNPEAPPDPSIDWPSYAVDATPIRSDGSYSVEGLADGVYKAEVFQFQSDTIVPKGVWKTIAIAGEDLVLDLQARE